VALERQHITQNLEDELNEVASLLEVIGIPETECDLHGPIINHYRQNPDALLKIMVALEFGMLEQEERSPARAGLISCGVFILGSLPSVIPFIFSGDAPLMGLVAAAVATTVSLLDRRGHQKLGHPWQLCNLGLGKSTCRWIGWNLGLWDRYSS
jgi:VIT1/CCC1 family predicted Fe2+/Mn2+ transporter